jgi:hypothetical protein
MDMDEEKIIETIRSGKTKMRSRAYFFMQAALAALGAAFLFLLILFIVTFIIFVLQENGGFFAANFGPAGWSVFLSSLPWSIFLLSLALLLVLWLLLRRYSVVYHRPFLYTLLFLIVVISITAVFLFPSSIHGGIFRYASRNQMPVVAGVYEFETTPISGIGIYRGQVVTRATSSFVLEDRMGQTSTVFVTPAEASSALGQADPGDYVIVFGHGVATATIQASGVETIVDYQ